MQHYSLVACLAALTLAGGCHAQQPDYENAKSIQSDGTVAALAAAQVSVADIAAAALAESLEVPVSLITVDSVRAVTWPDGSIGCPEPGVGYAQVLTPGHKITLRAEGKIYVMHEANGHAVLCNRKKTAMAMTPGLNYSWTPQAAIARADLAKQLNVAQDQIIIARGKETQWPDTSMNCDVARHDATETPTDGFIITLRHGSRNYTYHTDMKRVLACPGFSDD